VTPGEYLEPSLPALVAVMESEISKGRKTHLQRRDIARNVASENLWANIAENYLQSLSGDSSSSKSLSLFETDSTTEHQVFYCFCDGGLGNRLNSLYTSLVLAKLLGRTLKVFSPLNTWCEAPFESLFEDSGFEVEAREMIDCSELIAQSTRVVWEDHLKLGLPFRTPDSYNDLSELLKDLKLKLGEIFYCSPLIPKWLDKELINEAVIQVKIRDVFQRKAAEFISSAFANQPYAGLHIRKTDYGRLVDENISYQIAMDNPNVMFFVCSDSKETEAEAAKLKNVRVRTKISYVEKRVQGGWNESIVDESGRVYPFNVRRPALSVEEAVVDLLVLARSQIVRNSNSTFLSLAENWSKLC